MTLFEYFTIVKFMAPYWRSIDVKFAFKGNIYHDFLLTNGAFPSRFFYAAFSKGKINRIEQYAISEGNLPGEVRKCIDAFWVTNVKLIKEPNILSREDKRQFSLAVP